MRVWDTLSFVTFCKDTCVIVEGKREEAVSGIYIGEFVLEVVIVV